MELVNLSINVPVEANARYNAAQANTLDDDEMSILSVLPTESKLCSTIE